MRNRGVGIVVAPLAALCTFLAACNPLTTDPVSFIELEQAAARYAPGPDGAWLEVAVKESSDLWVYALAGVKADDVTGPLSRTCQSDAGPEPCSIAGGAVLSTQRLVPPNTASGEGFVRLITLWPEEVVNATIVCVNPTTYELLCPDSLRVRLRTVDDGGALVGDLTAVPVS